MNAGAYGGEMKDVLEEITVLTKEGEISTIPGKIWIWGIDTSAAAKNGCTVLEAVIKLEKGDKVLIPRAKEAREVLPETLRRLGAEADVITAYETAAVCENAAELMERCKIKKLTWLPLPAPAPLPTFKSAGRSKELLEGVSLAAIGPVTAETCRKNGLTPAVTAGTFTIDGLTDAIKSYYIKV